MSTKGSFTLIGVCAVLAFIALSFLVFTTIMIYVLIGLGVILVLAGGGFLVRRWQHSGLPVKEAKREDRRLEYTHKENMARIAIEEDTRRHQAELERERQAHELELQRRWAYVTEHLALTRIPLDTNGNPPYLLDQPDRHITILPAGNPPYRPMKEQIAAPLQPNLIAAPIARPSQDQLLAALQEQNEPWTFSPGVNTANGSIAIVSLVKVPHLKIVGSTGFGKSCLAGAIIDQSTKLNSPRRLQLALLDLEHKTSRLFETLPHVAEVQVGKRMVPMVATDADEVALYTEYLKRELDRRTGLSQQELHNTPVLLMYVEEMLSLAYEPFDAKTLARLFANLTLLAVRGRKYGMFLLACMQIDYSTEELKVASKMFRFRSAAAVDVSAAKASGFINTDLIKQNFQTARKGEFVVEYPSFSNIVVAPGYDVEAMLNAKDGVFDEEEEVFSPRSGNVQNLDLRIVNSERTPIEQQLNTPPEHAEQAWQARVEEVRGLRVAGWGKIAIIEKIWHAQRGDNKPYRQAEKEYDRIIAQLEQEEREA
jgi:hypothetical protein